jgi:hypothetical protein
VVRHLVAYLVQRSELAQQLVGGLGLHGTADDNTGTFPIQSERLFAALQGLGGHVRYVQLPAEAHGYRARETALHVLWEELRWLDANVKNAKPRAAVARAR